MPTVRSCRSRGEKPLDASLIASRFSRIIGRLPDTETLLEGGCPPPMKPDDRELETDPRFPSGPWTGFFVQKVPIRGRFDMELILRFRDQVLTGEGRDYVGRFILRGRYSIETGECNWTKRYIGAHDVSYHGFNEGRGIWGRWEIAGQGLHGGFHIWPEGMADPSQPALAEAESLPIVVTEELEVPILG